MSLMERLNAMVCAGKPKQKWQETRRESDTRRRGSYPEVENMMPSCASRFDCNPFDLVTSRLGKRNPFGSKANPRTHEIWLFDNIAWEKNGKWNAEYNAAFFLKDSGNPSSDIIAAIAAAAGVGQSDVIDQRIEPFLKTIQPARYTRTMIDNRIFKLGPSSRDGISTNVVSVPDAHSNGDVGRWHTAESGFKAEAKTMFASKKGWAIISDIDDTIKVTQTDDAVGVVRKTFAERFQAIKGMGPLYEDMRWRLNDPPFWYLSASPYNLYPVLREFRERNFPFGELILREASWLTLAGILGNLTEGTQPYKVSRIDQIHAQFPERTFILIGDSTQGDPEAYGEVYRKYPGWVRMIFIRKVTGIAHMDEDDKNRDRRFEDAFKNIPRAHWHVFTDPEEIHQIHPFTAFVNIHSVQLAIMAPAAGGKKQKKKWSKGKVKDKANHAVILDKSTNEKLQKDVQSYRLITVATLVDRLKINGSLARAALKDLEDKGIIKPIVTHSKMKVYTRAVGATE
ncbi:hypothetical protein P152DRAFT_474651 [Eremomyces bilateralis CBS 781.70]|uniref:Phosphatidate phosphatase APP1 catalytic domain-containing protein n=1 Tax=Eremomyces bilateralis CBS 781.70 TaxID=1392243 RepID=A0A6G1G105_9PEZI|nr:uncharacterized protein P152DRAFT_474651 [Eremomyces bilateralis CBS 781.70]KAF1811489.1 hypothetical protein P152DRAFT_474651 [Eremomyces bilateralis CBS 781.70]